MFNLRTPKDLLEGEALKISTLTHLLSRALLAPSNASSECIKPVESSRWSRQAVRVCCPFCTTVVAALEIAVSSGSTTVHLCRTLCCFRRWLAVLSGGFWPQSMLLWPSHFIDSAYALKCPYLVQPNPDPNCLYLIGHSRKR